MNSGADPQGILSGFALIAWNKLCIPPAAFTARDVTSLPCFRNFKPPLRELDSLSIEKLAVRRLKSPTLITGPHPCVPPDSIIRIKWNSLNLPVASLKEGSHYTHTLCSSGRTKASREFLKPRRWLIVFPSLSVLPWNISEVELFSSMFTHESTNSLRDLGGSHTH